MILVASVLADSSLTIICTIIAQETSLIIIHALLMHNVYNLIIATIDAQWEGMGDVGSARYEPALLPLCPTIRVLSYSN